MNTCDTVKTWLITSVSKIKRPLLYRNNAVHVRPTLKLLLEFEQKVQKERKQEKWEDTDRISAETSEAELLKPSRSVSQITLFTDEFDQTLSKVVEVVDLDVEDLNDSLHFVLGSLAIFQRWGQVLFCVLHAPLQIHVTHL